MVAAVLLAIAAAGATLLAREQNASLPVRERIITRNFLTRIPPHPCGVPSVIPFIAGSVEAVSGIEYVAGPLTGPSPCDWRKPLPPPIEEINLLGMTVEETLNTLVKIDPRYAWQESGGVIMLRPVDAWVDDKHFLHESIGPIEFENKPFTTALDRLQPIIGRPSEGRVEQFVGHTPHGWHEFSVRLPVMSAFEALNAIVRAHGNLHWDVTYCNPERRRENAILFLRTTDLSGHGTPHRNCTPRPKPKP
jgi:hypothetical protein